MHTGGPHTDMTEIVRDPDHSRGAPTIDDTGVRVLAGAYDRRFVYRVGGYVERATERGWQSPTSTPAR